MILEQTNPALNGIEKIIELLEVHIKLGTAIPCNELGAIKTLMLEVKTDYIASNEAYLEANSSIISMEAFLDLATQLIQLSAENSEVRASSISAMQNILNSNNVN